MSTTEYRGSSIVIDSCVISYIATAVTAVRIGGSNIWVVCVCSTGLAVVVASLLGLAVRSPRIGLVLRKYFHMTLQDDAMEATVDLQNGSIIKAFLKGKDYYYLGDFKTHDNKRLVIGRPEKYTFEGDLIWSYEQSADVYQSHVMLKYDDMDAIEIYNLAEEKESQS